MIRKLFASAAAVAAVAGLAAAAELMSGPQPGEKVPGPFAPLNVNGEAAGKKHCLYCQNGDNPVVMIFARCTECPMTAKLIKEVDGCVAKHSGCDMGSFVVFCTDDDKAADQAKQMADKAELKKVVLSIDNPQGPAKYKINKDADVTVVLYAERKVKANHAFKKGELTEDAIQKVLKEIPSIAKADK